MPNQSINLTSTSGFRKLADIEAEVIEKALIFHGWQKKTTANALNITRPTLDRKIGAYKIGRDP